MIAPTFDPISEALSESPRAGGAASESHVVAEWGRRLRAQGWENVRFELLVRNRNTTVFRVWGDQAPAVLKLNVARPVGSGVAAARAAERLNALMRGGAQEPPCPRVLGIDEASDSALYEFIEGRELNGRPSTRDIADALDMMAAMHRGNPAAGVSTGAFLRSLDTTVPDVLPEYWRRFGRVHRERADLSVQAQLLLDFTPRNLIRDLSGRLVLIDPPERDLVGPRAWDLAVFFVGLHASMYRSGVFVWPGARSRIVATVALGLAEWEQQFGVRFTDVVLCMSARLACIGYWLSGAAGYRGSARSTVLRLVRQHYLRSAERFLLALAQAHHG